MRCRWARVGLSAFLAAIVLTVSPVAMAKTVTEGRPGSLGAFWDQKEIWADQTVRKALRAARQPGRWEVLINVEDNGEWESQGFLKEIYRRRPEPSPALDVALKNTVDSLGAVLLIGEVRSSKGGRFYIVAAVLEQDSSLQDSEGRELKAFVPLHAGGSYQDARRYAEEYERVYDGSIGGDPLASPPGSFEKVAPFCERMCGNQRNTHYSGCNAQASACLISADDARDSCVASCGGASACINNCNAWYLHAASICTANYNSCTAVADELFDICINNCDDGGLGGCLVATETATAALALDGPAGASRKLASGLIDFALARSETRGRESFIMDEWAVVKNGRVRTSSNPAFARAVTDQSPVPSRGSFLMIQEPVHPMNSRHVPKPEVKISSTALARSERGTGEIVAARIELSPTRTVDRVEIVYTSRPMEESRLKELVSQRVGLVFASEKGHRTAVYLAFRLTGRIEVLDTVTVFPKCCCGGVYCI